MDNFDSELDVAYDNGFADGYRRGYDAGFADSQFDLEPRIKRLYANLVEMQARVDVISKKLDR